MVLRRDFADSILPWISNTWFTASFKNDALIIAKAAELHEELVEELKAFILDGDFITQCLFQPLPTLFGRRSAEVGGNVMGVEGQEQNGLLWLAVAMVRTPEQEAFAYPKVKAWVQAVKDFAATIENGNLEWIYLNYADKSQDPLASYGVENVKKMRDVAAKYDPEQVFQKLCPGGFKISDVKSGIAHDKEPSFDVTARSHGRHVPTEQVQAIGQGSIPVH